MDTSKSHVCTLSREDETEDTVTRSHCEHNWFAWLNRCSGFGNTKGLSAKSPSASPVESSPRCCGPPHSRERRRNRTFLFPIFCRFTKRTPCLLPPRQGRGVGEHSLTLGLGIGTPLRRPQRFCSLRPLPEAPASFQKLLPSTVRSQRKIIKPLRAFYRPFHYLRVDLPNRS